MDAILSESVFTDFGIDSLYPFSDLRLHQIRGASKNQLREQVRTQVPREPGVYGMLDCLGRLIYVGKSKLLRSRLLSYFLPGNEEDKSGRIVQSTQTIVWETQPSEFAALVREQSLIRKFQPRLNVQGIPRRQQQVYVCLGRAPAEQLFVSRRAEPSASVILGPLAGASRANRAVEILNRLFQLRDCSTKQACQFTDQLQLFQIDLRPGCLRLEIGNCLGPCIAACSRQEYAEQAQRARDFLCGRDLSAVAALKQLMMQAAENRHFEQAARIREDLRAVQWLSLRASDVANAKQHYTFVYPIDSASSGSGCSGSAPSVWYLIRNGVIEGAISAPKGSRQRATAQRAVSRWWNEPDHVGSSFVARPETLALVAGWFRKHPAELKRTLLPAADGSLQPQESHSRAARVCAS
jgi:excinuclease ABC subunit C